MKRRQKLLSCLVMAALVVVAVGRISAKQVKSISDPFLIEQLEGPPEAEYVPNEIIVKFRQKAAANIEKSQLEAKKAEEVTFSDTLDKLNRKHKLKQARPLFKGFKEHREQLQVLHNKNKSLLTKQEKHILQRLERAPKNVKVPDLDRIYKLELDLEKGQSLEEVVAAYKSDPDVEYAELNYITTIDSEPRDPLFPLQWPLDNRRQIYPESGDYNPPPGSMDSDIDAPEAWDIHTGSFEVVVAVIDTGVDYEHRDLDDNMWIGPSGNHGKDFINNDYDPMDDHGHGTHCAGIIAAEGDNDFDISGVCWDAKIMAIKAFDRRGYGNTATSALAICYAADQGADIISNSWGQRSDSDVLRDAIDYAHSQGVLLAASAGNGNREELQYPAAYENVISVAATDSHDHKNPLSNHADWVDIAAPGVDILSLRAQGTSMGTVYDNYTTIDSGTSMACPHVSGTLALMLSYYPGQSIEWITDKLLLTADDISNKNPYYVGRLGTGRVNAYKAVRNGFEGTISLNSNLYSCNDEIAIEVFDFDLIENQIQQVILETDAGDEEVVTLVQDANSLWVFKGMITTSADPKVIGDGILQVSHSQRITAIYYDENAGTGSGASCENQAMADCQSPVISNVEVINIHSTGAEISFETDEPAKAFVHGGINCSGPYISMGESQEFATSHKVYLPGLTSQSDYHFIVGAVDVVGNEVTDSNDNLCYSFTTITTPEGIMVPTDYPTIQAAIDAAEDGDTVWVAGGTYTGDGNRDIDFGGKEITLKSECGPKYCIIDCQGTEEDSHRGFYFHSGEDDNSVLDGLSVINGFGSGVPLEDIGLYLTGGGGIVCLLSSPAITNCVFGNNVAKHGGGMFIYKCHPKLLKCRFTDNIATKGGGGGLWGSTHQGRFINSVFEGNMANMGAGISSSSGTFVNCTIRGNTTVYGWDSKGGGINCWADSPTLINCTIINNWANQTGGAMSCGYFSRPTITHCTLSGNLAGRYGGGIFADESYPEIISSIIYGNESWRGNEMSLTGDPWRYSIASVSYSNIQGGWSGVYAPMYSTMNWGKGNIDADPCFADPNNGDYRLLDSSPCIDSGAPYYYLYGQHFTDINGECRLAGAGVDMGGDEFGSSPDSDADLLSDTDETIYGTRFDEPDSDDDGLLDGIEVLRGTDPDLADNPSGISIPIDYSNIQQGLFLAFPNETLTLLPGTYYENIHFQGKNVVLQSTYPDDEGVVEATVIDANGVGTVVTFDGSESPLCVIDGLTITDSEFGGIIGHGCEATISSCKIVNNNKLNLNYKGGGGICDCDGLIQNNFISGNTAKEFGGGIAFCDGVITENIISNNSSGKGGGISTCYGLIHKNTIVNNIAGSRGGGVYCPDAAPLISNCIITGNTSSFGGGLYLYESNAMIAGCIIAGNFARRSGGGIYSGWVDSVVINCTLGGNMAGSNGGAVAFKSRGMLTIANSIFYDNTANSGPEFALIDPFKFDPPSIDVSYSNVEGGQDAIYLEEDCTINWGEGNIDVGPNFRNPGYWEADKWIEGDYHLLPHSACIDAGDPEYLPGPDETDIDGQQRVIAGHVDMGADEFINTPPFANAGEDQVVFTWIDGMAEVKLDGSGSFDVDGDELEYYWYNDANDLTATGVDPNILLPVGEHTIELIVNDGTEDSESNEVVITIIGPVKADVHIVPRVINHRSRIKRIFAIMRLPYGIGKQDVADEPFVLEPAGIEANWQRIFGWRRRESVFMSFDKEDVTDALADNSMVELAVVGRLESGQCIYGIDTVRIFQPSSRLWGQRGLRPRE